MDVPASTTLGSLQTENVTWRLLGKKIIENNEKKDKERENKENKIPNPILKIIFVFEIKNTRCIDCFLCPNWPWFT